MYKQKTALSGLAAALAAVALSACAQGGARKKYRYKRRSVASYWTAGGLWARGWRSVKKAQCQPSTQPSAQIFPDMLYSVAKLISIT